jgi:CBS domain containing-hemolysin-like protein
VGVVSVKRLLPQVLAARNGNGVASARPFRLVDVMREVVAIPDTAPASALLPQLRDAHTPMAIVIDEYGGTAGLITLVDLVESLVGEITDELEPVSVNGRPTADGSFSLDGLTTLMEAKEYYGLDLENDADVETVGGYVFSRLGRPVVVGDEVASADGHVLRAEELDGLRVARVRVVPANGLPARADVIAGSVA